MTLEDLFSVERLSDFNLSPDGKFAWLASKRINLPDAKTTSVSTLLDCDTGVSTEVCLHEKGASGIVFSHDSKFIFYAADGQIYRANADGSNPVCLTHGKGGASVPRPSKDDTRVLFVRSLYEDKALQEKSETSALTLADIYALPHPKARARTADRLFYRHWDSWTENKRTHLFIVDVKTGDMRDLTPYDHDVPPLALGSACDYDFSPDGNYVAYVMNPDDVPARSTNQSVYLQKISGIEMVGEPVRISNGLGNDVQPRFLSPSKLAYTSMLEPNYEADDFRIKVYDLSTGLTSLYLDHFGRSIDTILPIDENTIIFNAQDFAHISLYKLDLSSNIALQLTAGSTYASFAVSNSGRVLAKYETLNMPAECVELSHLQHFEPRLNWPETKSTETVRFLTNYRDALKDVSLDRGRAMTYQAKDGTTLEGWIVLPPNFDPDKKYPLILLIHGGPQGAFLDQFHYRWNVSMFASRGAVTAFCNPRGSTGYGTQITRAISGRWSDECPDDIIAFLDAVLAHCPFVDPNRLTAAGASFGGFMINWLLGHSDRFKAFVSHDGIFNTEMSGYITDELWFSEHEFGGKPYECPENYIRHSPHRFVQNFNTPTLVVQGEQDFRCFISEGLALFTALQYKGVESRFLYFPDEGHWVLNPANAYVWYTEVLDWLMNHVQ